MKNLFLSILLFASANTVLGQIENEIRNYQDSTIHFLKNGRAIFLEALKENNLTKAKEVHSYLNELTEYKPYSGFSYEEELMVFLLFDSLDGWTSYTDNYKSFKGASRYSYYTYYNRPFGESNTIYPVLSKLVKENLMEIKKSVSVSDLTKEEKDLMELYLFQIITVELSEEYIAQYRAFKKEYQNSIYGDFFDRALPKPETKGAVSLSGGASVSIPTSTLQDNFNQSVGGFFSIDFGLRRVYGSLYADFSSNWVLKKEFQGNVDNELTTFSEGEYFSFFKGGLHVGYSVLRLKHLQIAPYANIAGGNLRSDRLKPEDSSAEFKVFNSFIYGMGMHCQIKIFEYTTLSGYTYDTNSGHGHLSLKFQAGYDRIALTRDEKFEGDLTTLRIGLVWGWENY